MLRAVLIFLALGACLVPAACGSGDVDPTGDYQITIVNRENGCHFEGWTEGTTTPYVVLGIRKSLESPALTGEIQGLAGAWVSLVLGTMQMTGEVDGDEVTLTLHGTRQLVQNGCSYNVIGTMHGPLEGDFLSGDIDYTTATNGSPDCGDLQTCSSRQEFNGTRPPEVPGGP